MSPLFSNTQKLKRAKRELHIQDVKILTYCLNIDKNMYKTPKRSVYNILQKQILKSSSIFNAARVDSAFQTCLKKHETYFA